MFLEKKPGKSDKPSPAEMLKKSSFIREIIAPDHDSLSYNGELIEDQLKQVVKNSVLTKPFRKDLEHKVLAYLKASVIKTKFKDPYDKHEFERDLQDEVGEAGYNLFKNNRLDLENIKNAVDIADSFAEIVFISDHEVKDALKEKVAEIRDMLAENYQKMPYEAKLAVTNKVAGLARELCIDLIEFITKK